MRLLFSIQRPRKATVKHGLVFRLPRLYNETDPHAQPMDTGLRCIFMRLDKFLKVSRIIKRRTVANEAADAGRVSINGKVAKPSAEVKEGDVIEIRFGDKLSRYEILNVTEHATKAGAAELFRPLP